MRPEAERFDELSVDGGDREVRGSARRVTVTGGATVVVRGIVSGPVSIDQGATLQVDGLFSGSVERNDGVLLIAGQANLDLRHGVGRLGLAIGSTVVDTGSEEGTSWTLTAKGELRRLEGLTGRTEVDASQLHYFEDQPPPLE